MPPKKRAAKESTSKGTAKRQKVEKETKPKKAKSAAKGKAPTTYPDQILAILQKSDKPLGLASIKKELISQYGRKESGPFKKAVLTAVKALEAEDRDDFVVTESGSSYHGGEGSAYAAARDKKAEDFASKRAAKEAQIREYHRQGLRQCGKCFEWIDKDCELDSEYHMKIPCPKCGGFSKFWHDRETSDLEYEY